MLPIVKNSDEYTKKFLLRVTVLLLVSAVGIGYYLYILTGHSGQCLFYNIFHRPCISCGATTAVMALLSGDVLSAVSAHPILTLALFPITLIFAVQDFFVCLYGMIKKKKTKTLIEYLLQGEN